MINIENQLHIRLPTEIYQKLKVKCALELISMQDYVLNLITMSFPQNLSEEQPDERHEEHESNALKLLQHAPLFYNINRNDLEKLVSKATLLHFSKGETIIREGDFPTHYYIIEKGAVIVSKISRSGNEFIIAIRYQGEPFGQPSFVLGEIHIAASIALEDTDVLAFRRKDFLSFMARNAIVGARIIHLEMERTCHLYEKIIDMISYSAPQRVANTLFMLSSHYGAKLRFTHKDIAVLSWTTVETTSRVITKLKNLGILNTSRGIITIKNQGELRTYGINTHSVTLPEKLR